MSTQYKLIFFTPSSALEACKAAVFAAGAGRYANPNKSNGNSASSQDAGYSECCFVTHGTGQFRPGTSAEPFVGAAGTVSQVDEARVEVVCGGADVVRAAIEGLKRAHQYEVPVYEVYRMEHF